MDTSLGSIGGANGTIINNNTIAAGSNNLSPQIGVTTNNLINGLNSLGLQSLQNNHFNRNELQVRSPTLLFIALLDKDTKMCGAFLNYKDIWCGSTKYLPVVIIITASAFRKKYLFANIFPRENHDTPPD